MITSNGEKNTIILSFDAKLIIECRHYFMIKDKKIKITHI